MKQQPSPIVATSSRPATEPRSMSLGRRHHARRLLGWPAVAVGLALALVASASTAADYPDKSRPIKVIVPTGPGSAIDLLARTYAKGMSDVAGLSVVVENKPGAEAVPGVQSFLAAPADGYTMLVVSNSALTLNPVMIPNLPYDPIKDMVPVAGISTAGLVMNMGASTTFKSVREFVAAARTQPNKYTCASSTTNTRMACEYFQAAAHIKLLNVPYKTTAAAMLAVASGESDMLFVDAGSSMAQWKSGRVRGMAVTTAQRLPTLANIPTMEEESVPDFLMSAWYAAYFRAGTPPQVVAAMRAVLRDASTQPQVTTALKSFVHEPLSQGPDELNARTRTEIAGWRKLIQEHGITLTPN